jgi:hypothetical protein
MLKPLNDERIHAKMTIRSSTYAGRLYNRWHEAAAYDHWTVERSHSSTGATRLSKDQDGQRRATRSGGGSDRRSSSTSEEPQQTDNIDPVEMKYLAAEPQTADEAIVLETEREATVPWMDLKQRRLFWWVFVPYTLLVILTMITDNGWLIILCVLAMLFIAIVGYMMMAKDLKLGAIWLGMFFILTSSTGLTPYESDNVVWPR